jgi:hypothetical protein
MPEPNGGGSGGGGRAGSLVVVVAADRGRGMWVEAEDAAL